MRIEIKIMLRVMEIMRMRMMMMMVMLRVRRTKRLPTWKTMVQLGTQLWSKTLASR